MECQPDGYWMEGSFNLPLSPRSQYGTFLDEELCQLHHLRESEKPAFSGHALVSRNLVCEWLHLFIGTKTSTKFLFNSKGWPQIIIQTFKKTSDTKNNHVNLNDHAFLFGEGNDLLTIKTAFSVIERNRAIHSSSLRKAARISGMIHSRDQHGNPQNGCGWKMTSSCFIYFEAIFGFPLPLKRRSFPIFSLQSVERTGQTQLKPLKWLRRSCLPHHAPPCPIMPHLFSGFTQSDLVGCFFFWKFEHWTSNKTKTSVVDPTS